LCGDDFAFCFYGQLFFVADGAVGADGSSGRACLPQHSTAAAHSYAQHRMLRQRRWALASVCDVLLRRFLMRRSAVELLLVTGRTVLLHFETRGDVASTPSSDARRHAEGDASTADGDGGGGSGGAYPSAYMRTSIREPARLARKKSLGQPMPQLLTADGVEGCEHQAPTAATAGTHQPPVAAGRSFWLRSCVRCYRSRCRAC
jgi:hypothetical protein